MIECLVIDGQKFYEGWGCLIDDQSLECLKACIAYFVASSMLSL